MARISVVIPTYNRPLLVQQAIESVLGQVGGHEFEIIVIDDGSAPATQESLEKYRGVVNYVRRSNAGLNPSRNYALGLASGDYVALLDDDDVWLPCKTEMQLAALGRYPQAAFVHSNFYIWKPDVGRKPDGLRTWFPTPYPWTDMYSERAHIEPADYAKHELPSRIEIHYGDIYRWSLTVPMVLPSTALIRRSALADGMRFPEFDSTGDWEFFARLSQRGGAVFIQHETTLNRSHEDATRLTRTDPTLRLRRRIAMIRRVWRQDARFSAQHGEEIDRIEAMCLRGLTRMYVARGDNELARAALSELKQVSSLGCRDRLLATMARVPFTHRMIALARRLPGLQ